MNCNDCSAPIESCQCLLLRGDRFFLKRDELKICPHCNKPITEEFLAKKRWFPGKMYHCQQEYYDV